MHITSTYPLLLLAVTCLVTVSTDANAAKSSKPREIVVVGSKVKEVIRSAGFATEGNVVDALNAMVLGNMDVAMDRAERNGRYRLTDHDLDCPADPSDQRMTKSEIIAKIARQRGYAADRTFLRALNDYAAEVLNGGMERASRNGRGTVRPYDL